MEYILNKLSSYNIFNYLFPGVLGAIIISNFTSFTLINENQILGVFLYYFYGMVVSRIGSFIMDNLIQKRLKWIKTEPYSNFIKAEKKDEKIGLLLEVNNTYRTLFGLFLTILFAFVLDLLVDFYSISITPIMFILLGLVLLLFYYSFKKNTGFIVKRIKEANKND